MSLPPRPIGPRFGADGMLTREWQHFYHRIEQALIDAIPVSGAATRKPDAVSGVGCSPNVAATNVMALLRG